jgi:hypothetical protein
MQSLEIPSKSKGTKFPLSSPNSNSPRSFRTGLTYRSREPSQSPYSDQGNPFADAESDTSGQDEFHLERYSQPAEQAKRQGGNDGRYCQRSESPRKRPRPGLNIVTDFPPAPARSRSEDMVLEQVPQQRPLLGNRAVTSVISQEAEHFCQPSQKNLPKDPGFVTLGTHLTRSAASEKKQFAQDSSPAERSVVIGISVPQHQAQNHNLQDLSSALSLYTPATPQIVVTPAQEEAPWSKPVPTPRRRPASSIYFQRTHNHDRQYKADQDAPPVPHLAKSNAFNVVTQWRVDPRFKQVPRSAAQQRSSSTDTVFDDEDDNAHHGVIQTSADSDEETILLTGDSARPKSKGWWNLALSPMLSRAGTVRTKRSPSEPSPVPPLPSKSPYVGKPKDMKDDFDEPLLSPETPRRLGMSSSRASTAGWTNWTEWEECNRAKSTAQTSEEDAFKGHKAQESSATVPFMIGATPISKGLAVEYFQACAFDQRGAEPYFECQNHSCTEQLPKLISSHDRGAGKGMLVDVPAPESTAARDLALGKLQGREPTTPRVRSDSNSTAIEDEPAEFSPNMRSANVGTIMKPTAFQPTKPLVTKSADRAIEEPEDTSKTLGDAPKVQETPLPTYYSPPARIKPQVATFGAVLNRQPAVTSPGPLSPEAHRDIAPRGAVPMSEAQQSRSVQAAPQRIFINNCTSYPDPPPRTEHVPVSLGDIERMPDAPPIREVSEKEDKPKKNFFGWLSCVKRKKEDDPKKKKKCVLICLIFLGLLAIIIACIVLAITLTRKGDNTPINTQWLNLTGFPPMPTGISTVIRPDVLNDDDSCVRPTTLWSCAVPKEQASEITPNDPDEPNFRFEIRFHNGTSGVDPADTIPLNGTGSAPTAEDPFTNDLFIPNPAPPSDKEQLFLGNTTDNITEPFDGEVTPFFISFITAFPVVPPGFNTSSTRLAKRQETSNTSLTLPSPATTSDGSPAAAQLFPSSPFPSSQPLRLYNRGLSTEHYGFYSYFDKILFLSTNSVLNNSATSSGVLPDDQNGGSFQNQADAMCTLSQTRFKVAIFTNPSSGLFLLPGSASSVPGSNPQDSAFDYDPPGSFPYPMSITLDRHGGDASKKAVFCYEMIGGEFVQPLQGILQAEFRGAGGTVVNSPPSLIAGASDNGFDPSLGGVDGGTGGCACEWGNFAGLTG